MLIQAVAISILFDRYSCNLHRRHEMGNCSLTDVLDPSQLLSGWIRVQELLKGRVDNAFVRWSSPHTVAIPYRLASSRGVGRKHSETLEALISLSRTLPPNIFNHIDYYLSNLDEIFSVLYVMQMSAS